MKGRCELGKCKLYRYIFKWQKQQGNQSNIRKHLSITKHDATKTHCIVPTCNVSPDIYTHCISSSISIYISPSRTYVMISVYLFTINKVAMDLYILLIFLHGDELPRTYICFPFSKQVSGKNSINNFSLKNPFYVVFDNMRKY